MRNGKNHINGNGALRNGDGVDRPSSRKKSNQRRPSPRHYNSQPVPPQRTVHFNSTRAAWTLSVLLLLTFITQLILLFYHDEFVFQMNALEGELLEDMTVAKSMADGVVDAAYQYLEEGEDDDEVADDATADTDADTTHRDDVGISRNKERLPSQHSKYSMEPADILQRAGVDYSEGFVPSLTVSQARAAKKNDPSMNQHRRKAELPSVEEVQSMYGSRTYIHGLERCEAFRAAVPQERRLMGPAGIFNSATNLLNRLLKLNCINKERNSNPNYQNRRKNNAPTGMLLQAPWGKHNPVKWRLHHEAAVGGKGIEQADFLPIVMIKDPITWMASMCRHSYEARWRHRKEHCPNLVPNKWDRGRKPGEGSMGLKVKFATQHIGDEPIPDKSNKTFVEYTSLVDLWNVWYRDWHNVDFPRLMVRFEDLMFHAEDTVTEICKCGGGTMRSKKLRYVEDSAKGQGGPHAGSAGFLASLITYGNSTLRNEGILTDARDLEYARKHLDKELMDMFGYAPI